MQKCRLRSREKGLTLIEVLLSILIAAIVLVGVVEAFLYLTSLSSMNRNQTVAFQNVQMTMERITGTLFADLNTQFPNNQALSGAFVTNVLGGYKLPGETITVSYPGGTTANPREIVVTGQWTERSGTRTIPLRTFRRG